MNKDTTLRYFDGLLVCVGENHNDIARYKFVNEDLAVVFYIIDVVITRTNNFYYLNNDGTISIPYAMMNRYQPSPFTKKDFEEQNETLKRFRDNLKETPNSTL